MNNWIVATATTIFISLTASVLMIPEASAQRKPISLFSNTCANGQGQGSWEMNSREIPVGRELQTSVIYMEPGHWWNFSRTWNTPISLICKLRDATSSRKYKSLRLSFGMSEQDNSPDTILTVYLDGNQVDSAELSPGQVKEMFFDVTSARTVSLEASCSHVSKPCTRIYFFRADLDPMPTKPGSRK